jgi:hypothetical protein
MAVIDQILIPKRVLFLFIVPIGPGQVLFPLLSVRPELPLPLQLTYITQQNLYPTHFYPEDGGSTFLRNVGIHLYDYTMPYMYGLFSEILSN